MNIYLLTNNVNGGYDTHDSAVVIAENESNARGVHPKGCGLWWNDIRGCWMEPVGGMCQEYNNYSWCSPKELEVELIGKAEEHKYSGNAVVLASFNAG